MDIKQKISELNPSEFMTILTLLMIIIGGTNLYAYHIYLGLNFLIDDITIPQLLVSTLKTSLGLFLCFILGFLLYKLGAIVGWFVGLFYSNFKEHKPRLWTLLACIPSISIYFILVHLGVNINYIIAYLIYSIALAFIFKAVNQNFSSDDAVIVIYVLLSFFAFGILEAKLDTNQKISSLPKVKLQVGNKDDWRIIKRVDDQVLIINLHNTKSREYQMIKIEDLNFESKKRAE